MSIPNRLRLTAVVAALALTSVAVAAAGQGAVVIRFDVNGSVVFFNEDDQIVSVHATEDGFFCEPSTVVDPLAGLLVVTPNTTHGIIRGTDFVKVYQPATPADFFADPCAFILGGPLVAEGHSTLAQTDNDLFVQGPGANAFGFVAGVHLEDVATGEKVNYSLVRRWLIKPDGSFKTLVEHGPSLK